MAGGSREVSCPRAHHGRSTVVKSHRPRPADRVRTSPFEVPTVQG